MSLKAKIWLAAVAMAIVAAAIGFGMTQAKETSAPVQQPMAEAQPAVEPAANSTQVQVIEIKAKGGYKPQVSYAKANTPTVIRINTDSTFDCSSALTIPQLDYRTRLPFSGVTSIDVPPQPSGGQLTGLCSMGMYSFTIKFLG